MYRLFKGLGLTEHDPKTTERQRAYWAETRNELILLGVAAAGVLGLLGLAAWFFFR